MGTTVLIIFVTLLYMVMGVGSITLVRRAKEDIPKFLAIIWPLLLTMAACGLFDKQDA
tara:strand:+ start:348 stop:521 length:174 start_codon:yes stop_codon:yes gene_type:complete